MLIPNNIKCSFCSRIFCCPNCRKLHEEKEHAVFDKKSIHKSCFICHGKALPLQKSISKLLMEHIVEAHLPLNCRKCNKIYNSKDDFEEIEKCIGGGDGGDSTKVVIKEEDETENKENVPIIEKTVPQKIIIEEVDEALLTPLSKINLKWRRKSAGFSTSDSSASVSAIGHTNTSHLKLAPQSATKLVRTTSTPMTQMLTIDSLCGSSYQASSIEPSCSGNETDQSSSMTSNNCSPSPAFVIKRNDFAMQRYPRYPRQYKVQTPLRQVMSKSIQRAIQAHRNQRPKLANNGIHMPRKMIFTSMSSSDGSIDESKTPQVTGVLDLRTTPVLKRTMSAPNPRAQKHEEQNVTVPKERHKSDESIILDILLEKHAQKTEFHAKLEVRSENVIRETKYEPGISPLPPTPEIESSLITNDSTYQSSMSSDVFKSCFKDDTGITPFKPFLTTTKKSAIVTPMQSTKPLQENSFGKEIWYTPKNISTKIETPEEFENIDIKSDEDDVFEESTTNFNKEEPQSRIWKIFSSVMKYASGTYSESDNNKAKQSPKKSLVTRSLSHLGFIRQKRTFLTKSSSAIPHLKRKRNTSSQSSTTNNESPPIPELRSPVAKKYKSITGRKPIHRMSSN